MPYRQVRSLFRIVLHTCVSACFLAPGAVWAQSGWILGKVFDERSRTPLENAEVFVRDARLGAVTDKNGHYIFRAPAGLHVLRVKMAGYATQTLKTTVEAGDTLVQNFHLRPRPYTGEEVIITDQLPAPGPGVFDKVISAARLKYGQPALAEADPLRMIQATPGVASTSDFSSQLFVRGSPSDQTLIAFDGVTIYSPYHIGGIFSLFNADGVQAIEFSPAVSDVRVSSRLAGRLNIIPAAGDSRRVAAKASLGVLSSKFMAAGPAPRGSWFLSGRRTYIDIVSRILKKTGLEKEADLQYYFYDLQGGLVLAPSPRHKISVNGYFTRDVLRDALEPDEQNVSGLRQPEWGNNLLSLRWKMIRSSKSYFETQAAFSAGLMLSQTLRIDVDNRMSEAFLKSVWHRLTGRQELQAGVKITRFRFNYHWLFQNAESLEGTLGDRPAEIFFDFAPQSYDTTNRVSQIDVFLQNDFKLTPRLNLLLGLRGEKNSLSQSLALLPRIHARFAVRENLSLHFGAGRHVQYAYTLKNIKNEDIFAPFSIYFPIAGDEPLLRASTFTLGSALTFQNGAKLGIEAYHKRMRDIPVFNEQIRRMQRSRINARGIDIFLEKNSKAVNFTLGYSLGFSRIHEPERTYFASFDRLHSLKFSASLRIGRGWRLTSAWAFLSGLPYTPFIGRYVSRFGAGGRVAAAKNSFRYPPYHRLDAGFAKDGRHFGLTLNVLNIYNRANPLFYDWDFEFVQPKPDNLNNFPILPTLDFSFRF